jgi:ER membrane protein complex subunit 1
MRYIALFFSAFLYFSFPGFVFALFQDEAFQIDYQHTLLGRPIDETTFFHHPSLNSKASLVYTLSERLVLGALNPKDGAVVWRHNLGEGIENKTSTPGFLCAANNTNLIFSAVGSKISAWGAADGRLVWEWQGKGIVRSLKVLEIDPLVVFEDNGSARMARLNAMTGKMIWDVADKS